MVCEHFKRQMPKANHEIALLVVALILLGLVFIGFVQAYLGYTIYTK